MAEKDKNKDSKEKEDVKETGQDAAPADAGAAGPDKTKTVVMLLIVLSILVMILTPIITIFAIRAIMPKDNTEGPKPEELNKKITEIPLLDFKCNIGQTQGTRYAQIDVVVEVSDGGMKKFFEAKTQENLDGMLNKIRSAILNIISDKTLDGLLSKDAKALLSKEIKSDLNEMLQKKTDGVVTEVYFPKFLVQ